MNVIKLGGSLFQDDGLPLIVNKINQSTLSPAVIVTGGGRLANEIRCLQSRFRFDDYSAHHMAILAMQQTALVCHSMQQDWPLLKSVSTLREKEGADIRVWMPQIEELDQCGVEASWDVTSDSLAAWLAKQLGAQELLVVKSTTIDPKLSLSELQKAGVLDRAFIGMISDVSFNIRVIHHSTL